MFPCIYHQIKYYYDDSKMLLNYFANNCLNLNKKYSDRVKGKESLERRKK